jgi:hypothetical protein
MSTKLAAPSSLFETAYKAKAIQCGAKTFRLFGKADVTLSPDTIDS